MQDLYSWPVRLRIHCLTSMFRPGILPSFTLVSTEVSITDSKSSRNGTDSHRTAARAAHRHQTSLPCRSRQQELNNVDEILPLSLTMSVYNTKGGQ